MTPSREIMAPTMIFRIGHSPCSNPGPTARFRHVLINVLARVAVDRPPIPNTVKLSLMPRRKGSHLAPRPLAERIGCIVLPAGGLLLCALYAYLILWKPARMVIAARNWNAVPCRIVSSEVVRVPVTGGRTIYK